MIGIVVALAISVRSVLFYTSFSSCSLIAAISANLMAVLFAPEPEQLVTLRPSTHPMRGPQIPGEKSRQFNKESV